MRRLGLWLLRVSVGRRTSGGGVGGGCGLDDHCCCHNREWLRLGHVLLPSLVTSLRVLSQTGERSLPSSLFILHVGVVRSFI